MSSKTVVAYFQPLCKNFLRWFIMDSILDWVPKMIERSPGVLVAVLGVYQILLMNDKLGMTKEFIGLVSFFLPSSWFQPLANNALPTLLPLSMDSSLSLNQFQSYMTVIRNMLDKIEQEQTNKLRSINEVKGENMSQQVTLGQGWQFFNKFTFYLQRNSTFSQIG